jgi:hypothetical protein
MPCSTFIRQSAISLSGDSSACAGGFLTCINVRKLDIRQAPFGRKALPANWQGTKAEKLFGADDGFGNNQGPIINAGGVYYETMEV